MGFVLGQFFCFKIFGVISIDSITTVGIETLLAIIEKKPYFCNNLRKKNETPLELIIITQDPNPKGLKQEFKFLRNQTCYKSSPLEKQLANTCLLVHIPSFVYSQQMCMSIHKSSLGCGTTSTRK